MIPYDTLAHHTNCRPLATRRDFSKIPCYEVASRVSLFMSHDTNPATQPETDALWFYLLNHGMSALSKRFDPFEPLGKYQWVMDGYNTVIGPKVLRATYYLLLISVRESRHLKNAGSMKPKLDAEFGNEFYQYLGTVPDSAGPAQKKFVAEPPNCLFGPFVDGLTYVFNHASWPSQYGGKKWGVISDTLGKFVKGVTSAEVMMDTVFTLSHNTCSIFNKGMFYAQGSSLLQRVLDVQRSGQIPQLIATDAKCKMFLTPELGSYRKRLEDAFGDEFGGPIDWQKVKDMGALGTYNEVPSSAGLSATKVVVPKIPGHWSELPDDDDHKDDFLVCPAIGNIPALYLKKIKRAA